MRILRYLGAALGILLALLGGLWLLQGTGLVVLQPIVCVAECETVTGPNLAWVIYGLIAIALGAALAWFCLRRR